MKNKHMKKEAPSPKRRPDRTDPIRKVGEKLAEAEKRMKKRERELGNHNDEIELLKKAERSFQRKK
ncbi:MAG: hypothetical protein MJA28_08115 [Gammaproteobacteria bacterium]|nr:hypothetical protein [Gammaproteobacteria bacterium]